MKKTPGATSLKPDNPDQSKRFREIARELKVDESGKAFERTVGVVVPPIAHEPGESFPKKPG